MKKAWIALVLGALLIGTMVGVVWARPSQSPQAADITRKITIPGGFFSPTEDGYDWYNTGNHVRVDSGTGSFIAPVVFPCLPSVTVERVILYADDQNGGADATAILTRTKPSTGQLVMLGPVSSTGSAVGIRTFTSANINKVVWPAQGIHVRLFINGTNMLVYGVTVEYHRNI